MRSDYHMHTSFSLDSDFPMEEEIRVAISRGLEEICFTEHVDHLDSRGNDTNIIKYYHEYKRCKEIYKDQITLKFGIEFGIQPHTVHFFQDDFKQVEFDFVILSCHQVDDKELWNKEYQQGKTQEELNIGYYENIYKSMLLYKDYSVLGHLDAIKRDDPYGEYDDEKIMDMLTKILTQAIQDNKGIEVNTSNFRYQLSDLTPSKKILKLYYDLGGRIITIGTDSHTKDRVGENVDTIIGILEEIGFTDITTFTKQIPDVSI